MEIEEERYGKSSSPIFKLMRQNIVELATTVLEQDSNILEKVYRDQPQKIKLNNEVGLEWVRRNFASFPANALPIAQPCRQNRPSQPPFDFWKGRRISQRQEHRLI